MTRTKPSSNQTRGLARLLYEYARRGMNEPEHCVPAAMAAWEYVQEMLEIERLTVQREQDVAGAERTSRAAPSPAPPKPR